MGNRICRSRSAVEERLTRPQRLLRPPSNVDYKKLRKLILSKKLAPCFDALEEPGADLEECPICFFYYPSLNRSRCCGKGICTECFLQMKPSNAIRPAECPFCKTSSYAVEYRGARSEEEKGLELVEEQKVIEAKIRMKCQESQTVEQLMLANETCSVLDAQTPTSCLGGQSGGDIQIVSSGVPLASNGSPVPDTCNPRNEDFDADLEEIMLMEAIWQSLKCTKLQRSKSTETSSPSNKTPENEAQDPNKNVPIFSFIAQHEASSSESSSRGAECTITNPVEHSGLRSGEVEQICDMSEANLNPCEDPVEGSDGTESEIDDSWGSVSARYLEVNHGVETAPTSDDSWGSVSVGDLEESHGVEIASASDGDTAAEGDPGPCCSSFIYYSSSGTPPSSGDGAGRCHSKLSDLMDAERPVMIVMESNARF